MSETSPFDLLSSIKAKAVELAEQGNVIVGQSAGVKNIAFMIGEQRYYCEASVVKEVSTCEALVPVPQTKRWMRGLVNSKGVLYSVSDLSLLAGHDRVTDVKRGHLLITSDDNSQSALLVSRVLGFRYFDQSDRIVEPSTVMHETDGLSSYVDEGYLFEDHEWFRLDLQKLLASEQFREIQ